jgi:predicted PurR-regulated permease PerM
MAKKKKAQQQPAPEPPPASGRTLRLSLFVVLSLAALTLVYFLSDIFAPVLGALALAYMLDPLVKRLEKRGWRRKRAVLAVFSATIFAVVLVFAVSIPYVVSDVHGALTAVTRGLEAGDEKTGDEKTGKEKIGKEKTGGKEIPAIGAGGDAVPKRVDDGLAARLVRAIKKSERLSKFIEWAEKNDLKSKAVRWLQANAKALAGGAIEAGKAGLGFLAALGWWSMMLALFPVYLYSFMMGLGGLQQATVGVVPPSMRPKASELAREFGASMAAFFRGRLVISLAMSVFTAAGFAIVNLRFGILLGTAIGLASIVPFLNVVFLVPALLIALFQSSSFGMVALVFAIYAAGQALDPILTPYLLSRGTGLHPVTIIVSIFVWGRLLGATGLLLGTENGGKMAPCRRRRGHESTADLQRRAAGEALQ